jgi:hypothetical protein
MDRSFTASAIRHRFSTKFLRDRSGMAALTRITPTILATTGPAAQGVPRRSAIPIESAMAPPGIPRTPPKDAARQRWKRAAAPAFSTVSQSTDSHRPATGPSIGCRGPQADLRHRAAISTWAAARQASSALSSRARSVWSWGRHSVPEL